MSTFIVVNFPDAAMVHQATGAIKKIHAERSVKVYASAVVARDSAGKLTVQEVIKQGFGGTAAGALIGGLAGMPLGPLAVTLGAAGGAIFGVSADLVNESDDDKCIEKIARELEPGKAVVVAEVADDEATSFKSLMGAVGGIVAPS